jgi:hypothetical protein
LGAVDHTLIPAQGPYDVDLILDGLNRRPFREWPVGRIISCPQPKVYDGARAIFAMRILPYIRFSYDKLKTVHAEFDMARLDFITETMDQELAVLIQRMGLPEKPTGVLLGFCASAKKILKINGSGGDRTAEDLVNMMGAAQLMTTDLIGRLGFGLKPSAPDAPHPLAHERIL